MTPVALLDGVWKRYRLGAERSNWRALIPGPAGERDRGPQFDALEDISLEINAGDSLGIIGENGAGKSTLLKILAGIVRPSRGTVQVNGRIASVIELGVGFNPELTGEENLRFAGSLMGLTASDLALRYDSIVEFADLSEFMGMPVKRYSTGMRARLGFALVTSFESDLVILDEVLSVGDWGFQQRSLQRILELHRAGAAIVAVSHSNWLVTQVCTQAILLESGRVVASGDALSVVERYLGKDTVTDAAKDSRFPVLPSLAGEPTNSPVRLRDLVLGPEQIYPNDPLTVRFTLEVVEPVDAELVMSIYTMGRAVFADPEIGPSQLLRERGTWTITATTARLPFSPGAFKVRIAAVERVDPEDHLQEHLGSFAILSCAFNVIGPPSTRPGLLLETTWSSERAES